MHNFDPGTIRTIIELLDSVEFGAHQIRLLLSPADVVNEIYIKKLMAMRTSEHNIELDYELGGSPNDLVRLATVFSDDPDSWSDHPRSFGLKNTIHLRRNDKSEGVIYFHAWSGVKDDWIVGYVPFSNWPPTDTQGQLVFEHPKPKTTSIGHNLFKYEETSATTSDSASDSSDTLAGPNSDH